MRRLAIAAVLAAVLAAALAFSAHARGAVGVGAPTLGAPGGPAVEPVASAAMATPAAGTALARAYAALGAARDAGVPAPPLDAEAAAVADLARELLDGDRPRRGGGRPSQAPGTTFTVGGPAAETVGASGDAVDPAAAEPGVDLAATTTLPDARTALRDGPDGPLLLAPGLWADTRYVPAAFPRGLRVADRCAGGYAVRVLGPAERVRLDGGLVVPGRWYRVRGEAVVAGDAACAVEIRPLSAVPAWHEAPPAPPAADG